MKGHCKNLEEALIPYVSSETALAKLQGGMAAIRQA